MKIAILAPTWFAVPPTGYGGIELVVSLLADGLVDAGHDVTLFASGDSLTKANLSYIFDEAPSELIGRTLPEIRHALACYERADEFDVINDHSGIPAAALGGLVQTPVLHTVHGPLDTHEAQHAYASIAEVAPGVGLISISENQRRPMPDLPWAATIPNAIDLSHLSVQAAQGRLPPLPRPLQPGQGSAPGGCGRDGARPAAEDGGQEPRAEGAAVLRGARRASRRPRRDRVPRRGLARREGRAAPGRAGDALPDRVGGAVRPRDDRVDGLRDAGDRDPSRRRARGDRARASAGSSSTTTGRWAQRSSRRTGSTRTSAGGTSRSASRRSGWSATTSYDAIDGAG